jgi:ABC-type Fe3+ transport system substrate-binding protein
MRISRRTVLGAGIAGGLAAGLGAVSTATASTTAATTATQDSEQEQLQALYRQAKAEGGKMIVYMGGDAPGQWDFIAQAFTAQYPGIEADLIVDLSKYHDARIDNQLATRDLVADMAILQTAQDFDRWKDAGELLRYKPVGWDAVFSNAKDSDGYWTGVFYAAFSPIISSSLAPADPTAFRATDLLKPMFKDKVIATYPNDDDAVLFQYKLNIDHYGWKWLEGLVAQNPTFLRGVPGSGAGVANGKYLATPAAAGDPRPNGTVVLPRYDRFVSWSQRAAIFRQTAHPATAKLFLSWLTSATAQASVIGTWTWSTRADVAPPNGLKPLAEYQTTDATAFPKFMRDRAAVERFRSQVELYVGRVVGSDPADPAETLGRTPGRS